MHKSNAVIVELDTLLDFLEKSIEDPQSRWEQLRDFIATQKAAQQSVHTDAAHVCGECGEPFDFCAMGHYDVEKARRR